MEEKMATVFVGEKYALGFFSRILAMTVCVLVLVISLISCNSGKDNLLIPVTPSYTVGGTVSGLAGSGLVLQNNAGDNLSISANGTFTFATPVASGAAYAVTVMTQPTVPSQTCTVSNGNGTIASAAVTNVAIACTTNTYTVGGTVSGLAGSGLVLQNNASDDLSISADGAFTFATPVASGGNYAVTVIKQPAVPSQTCTVSNGSGTIASAAVTNVAIACTTNTYTVGGTVGGLTGSGLVLQNNTSDDLSISADGTFTFATSVASGATYAVTVMTQPRVLSQICTITNDSGTIVAAPVDNVQVSCVTPPPRFAYVANQSNSVSAFTINATTGALTPVAGSPFAAGASPNCVTVDPTGKFAYVPNFNSNNISVYTINTTTGALTPVVGSPFATGGNPFFIAVDPTGRFAYTANYGSSNVSAFTINATTGALTPVTGSPFAAGIEVRSVTVDPTGKFAYATNGSPNNNISAYTINATTGALTPVVGSPFAAGSYPDSVAVDPTGKFAYAANMYGGVSAYTIGASGALTPVVGSPFGAGASPWSVTVDPTGKFVYVDNYGGGVWAYTIGASGALTPVAGSPFGSGNSENSVAVDPTGKFAYVPNYGSSSVSAFTINATTGALTPVVGSPFAAGATWPTRAAITR